LPAQGKPLESDLDDMVKSLNIALEDMEKAAALVEDSYESGSDKPTDEPPTITNTSKSKEPATRSPTIDGGGANNTLEETDELTDEPLVHAPDVGWVSYTTMEVLNEVAELN
jgi:hypothetical protein